MIFPPGFSRRLMHGWPQQIWHGGIFNFFPRFFLDSNKDPSYSLFPSPSNALYPVDPSLFRSFPHLSLAYSPEVSQTARIKIGFSLDMEYPPTRARGRCSLFFREFFPSDFSGEGFSGKENNVFPPPYSMVLISLHQPP